jgi:regulator of cell morphogenesis and NO signaling
MWVYISTILIIVKKIICNKEIKKIMNINHNTVETPVGQLVAQRPSRFRVFEELGIDYCCGGAKTLAQACREKQIALDTVVELLRKEKLSDSAPAADPSSMSLTELVDHIEKVHHAYLRDTVPRLRALFEKVVRVHGERLPWLCDAQKVFASMADELNSHMLKEEQVLFPMIRRIEAGDATAGAHCGGPGNPIRVMMIEHDHAGDALKALRELSDGFEVPPDACNSVRVLLAGLAEVEHDMHVHIHKENNVLFPRSLKAVTGSPTGSKE